MGPLSQSGESVGLQSRQRSEAPLRPSGAAMVPLWSHVEEKRGNEDRAGAGREEKGPAGRRRREARPSGDTGGAVAGRGEPPGADPAAGAALALPKEQGAPC